MKKKILIAIGLLLIILLCIFIYSFVISFKVVKKNTDLINAQMKKNFQKIVRIPEPVPPALRAFYRTNYTWEMETREKEFVTVTFSHNPGFSKFEDKIYASIEMSQGGDPSLFVKVLPAMIADEQALKSAQDLEHANLGSNETIGYNQVELTTSEKNPGQVTKILWEFDKRKISEGTQDLYEKLYKYNEPILKLLFNIQRSTLILLAP